MLQHVRGFLDHAALRSRFVWRPSLRRVPSMRVEREPSTGVILQGLIGNRTDAAVLGGLRDLALNLHAGHSADDELIFDGKGRMLTQLRNFDFGLYLAARTERVVAALVELPMEVWAAELLVAGTAFVIVQLPQRWSWAFFIAAALALPLLLVGVLAHLRHIRRQLISPMLSLQATKHTENSLRRLEQDGNAGPIAFGSPTSGLGVSMFTPHPKRGSTVGFSALRDTPQESLREPLLPPARPPPPPPATPVDVCGIQ